MARDTPPESLDDFLARSRICGRLMAKLAMTRGLAGRAEILAEIEKICRELSPDWGLSPSAVRAGIRMYLAGANDVLFATPGEVPAPPPAIPSWRPPSSPWVEPPGPILCELRRRCATAAALGGIAGSGSALPPIRPSARSLIGPGNTPC